MQLSKYTLVLLLVVTTATYALPRDKTERDRFVRANPCPANGNNKGPCPGYEVDHKKALMNGGKDTPENMQWHKREDHKQKTKQDFEECKKKATKCKHRGVKHSHKSK